MDALRVTLAQPGEQALRVQISGSYPPTTPSFNLTILQTANSDHTSHVGTNTFYDAVKLHYDGSFYPFKDNEPLPYNFECIAVYQNNTFLGVAAPYIRVGPANDSASSNKCCRSPLFYPFDVQITNISTFQNATDFYPCFATCGVTWGDIQTLIKPS